MKRIYVFLLCCAALSACTLTPKYKPDTSVTPPAVGRPAPPSSPQQADASEAFTPYGSVSMDSGDSLAPSMSFNDLSRACMTSIGYPNTDVGSQISLNLDTQPFGSWGYLGGAAAAEQNGFAGLRLPVGTITGSATTKIGTAQFRAMSKCFQAEGKFSQAEWSGPLELIQTLENDIQSDVSHDPSVKSATHVWAACMARNGYHATDPQSVAFGPNGLGGSGAKAYVANQNGGGVEVIGGPTQETPAQRRAQLALAVTDADCTQSSDLGGIYFAVKASYAQQIVNQNQQALTAAVSQYRAAYQKALATLPRAH